MARALREQYGSARSAAQDAADRVSDLHLDLSLAEAHEGSWKAAEVLVRSFKVAEERSRGVEARTVSHSLCILFILCSRAWKMRLERVHATSVSPRPVTRVLRPCRRLRFASSSALRTAAGSRAVPARPDHRLYGYRRAITCSIPTITHWELPCNPAPIHSAAADWSRWPAGTMFRIVETGELYQVDDYGWALAGTNTIDLYKPSRSAMNAWGVRRVTIENSTVG